MKNICLLFALLWPCLSCLAQRSGKDYALFFVTSKFDNGWTTLDNAPAEVKAIGDLLRDQYGFEVQTVSDATRAKIVQTLGEYKRKTYGPKDQLLVFFSMHGVHDTDSDQGYLVPKDGLYNDPTYESWYSHAALRDLAHSMKCPRILVALDACYSGIFGKGRDRPSAPVWENAPDCQSKLRSAFGEGITRKYLTAGGDTRVPAKSIFAAQWQVALRTGAGSDELLSYTELMAKLDEFRDPRPTWGNFIPGTDGDFVFVRKNACTAIPENRPAANKSAQSSSVAADQDKAQWHQAEVANTVEAYRKYLRECGLCLYIEEAEAAIKHLGSAISNTGAVPNEMAKSTVMPDGMAFVKGGTLQMGSPSTETGRGDDERQHEVELSDFYIGKYEVTVAEFKKFIDATAYRTDADKAGTSWIYTAKWKELKGVNWKCDTKGNLRPFSEYNHPVLHVSWNDAVEFCNWLSKQNGQSYRLPTEAEWEYAAKGSGQAVLFGNGKNIADHKEINFNASATYKKSYSVAGEYRAKTVPVGSLNSPNALGLHDMSGNVWEWCSDWYGSGYYKSSPDKNPTGPSSGSNRVIRSGSWYNGPQSCRAANRSNYAPGVRSSYIGFRLARTD